ncbi:hypothetical protein [Lichenicoccus sp.]|uniref:hypothetical protein n=1 Tax=Lichenicoccus sp. TaxID=2781899 RepID=UPI003D137420
MDIQTIDQQYSQLQGQAQQTAQALQTLGAKLQTAAQGGDPQAREWQLDLRELALAFRSEQDQVANLLQALHGFVANEAQSQMQMQPQMQPQQMQPPPQQNTWGQNPGYGQQPVYGQQPASGGMFGGFLNSGFGRAITMGAGFGIGDDLINKIF